MLDCQEHLLFVVAKKNYERDNYGELIYHALDLALLLKLALIYLNVTQNSMLLS
jgi:hypothetical protein